MLAKQELKEFIKLCMKAKDEAMLDAIFELFFTPEEKVDLSNRYSIIRALIQGDKTQRDMAKELHVSIAKITRGSNELKRIDEPLFNFLRKHAID